MGAYNILLTVSPGPTYRFATKPLLLSVTGGNYQYIGGLGETELPSIGEGDSSVTVKIPTTLLNPQTLRAQGIYFGGASAEIAILEEGETSFDKRLVLLTGKVVPTSERRSVEYFEFQIAALEQQLDGPMPPWAIGDGSFGVGLTLPESIKGQTLPVIRGDCREVPLLPLYNYLEAPSGTIPDPVPFVICGHTIPTDYVLVKLDGDDSRTLQAPVSYMRDPVSGSAAAVALIARTDAQGAQTFIAEVRGPQTSNGTTISGLGDVILDVIQTFGRVPDSRIDWSRFSRFTYRANRIQLASVFGGSPGQMAIQTLQSRFGSYPIVLDWRNGMIGADWLGFDYFSPLNRHLRFGYDLLDRGESLETIGDTIPYSEFQVIYDYNTSRGNFRKVLTTDWNTSDACRRAYSRFGRVRYPDVTLVDVNSDQAARAVSDAIVDLHAINRTQVSYIGNFSDFVQLPLFDKFEITDSEMGFVREPFRLETIKPRISGRCELVFKSFRDVAFV